MDLNNLSLDLSEFKDLAPIQEQDVNKGLKMIMGLILDSLTPELCRQLGLKLIEVLEDLVKKTDNKIDDMIVSSFSNKIRELLGDMNNHNFVTDNDDIKLMLAKKVNELSDELDNTIQTNINLADPSKLFDNISIELNKIKKNNPFDE